MDGDGIQQQNEKALSPYKQGRGKKTCYNGMDTRRIGNEAMDLQLAIQTTITKAKEMKEMQLAEIIVIAALS